jgi:hypothetical protein
MKLEQVHGLLECLQLLGIRVPGFGGVLDELHFLAQIRLRLVQLATDFFQNFPLDLLRAHWRGSVRTWHSSGRSGSGGCWSRYSGSGCRSSGR